LGNNYTSGSGTSGNSNAFVSRREMRATNATGALPVISTGRTYTSSFDIEELIASLHELFALDRQTASQQDSTRCGICYMHFSVSSLVYREEEGFYICKNCERTLGKQKIPMLRRQQKQQ
jgi:ribosomal protein S14